MNINQSQIHNSQVLLENNSGLKELQIGKQRVQKLLDGEFENKNAPHSYEFEQMSQLLVRYNDKIAFILETESLFGCE